MRNTNQKKRPLIAEKGMVRINHEHLPWNKRLRILRKISEITQEQAAQLCSTHAKNYWLWEKGWVEPNDENKKIIAKAFQVSEKWLFG